MILPCDSPDAEIVLTHATGKQVALGRVLVALSAVAWSTAGIFTKDFLITTQAKFNLSSLSGIGGVLSAT